MLSLERLRSIDPELERLSDSDVEAIRQALYEAAQLAFDVWWKKRGSNNPVRLLTKENLSSTM